MKIRTDFVTNSSSSSFTVQIDVTLADGNVISFKNTSDAGEGPGVYESVFVDLSPKKMGEAGSVEALIGMLERNVKGNVWSDEEQGLRKESVFKDDSASKSAKSFLKKLRSLNSMDEIKSIHVSGTETMDKVDHTDVTYDLQEKTYTGERYGHAFDEYPNGGCGGSFILPDEDQCDLKEAVSYKGKVVCELCGEEVKPERAYFAKHESDGLYRFCSEECCDEVLSWFGNEDEWTCGGLDLIKSLKSEKESQPKTIPANEGVKEIKPSEEEKKARIDRLSQFGAAEIGKSLYFGSYPQVSNESLDPIEWIVLDKKDSDLFVISKYLLDRQPFHTSGISMPWSDSLIRSWLNGAFLEKAFIDEEQAMIVPTTIREPDGSGAVSETTDKVFLLSEQEAKHYFPTKDLRRAMGTKISNKLSEYEDNSYWGLRSYKAGGMSFQYCTSGGVIKSNSFGADDTGWLHLNYDCTLGVRPAMWITTSHSISEKPEKVLKQDDYQSFNDADKAEKVPEATSLRSDNTESEERISLAKEKIAGIVCALKERYPEGSDLPSSFEELKYFNSDLQLSTLNKWTKIAFQKSARDYLIQERLLLDKQKATPNIFPDAVRDGKISSIQQEVHHADGSVTRTMTYGNDAEDGIDRSVNVFGTIGDIVKIIALGAKKANNSDQDTDGLLFMDNAGADYEVTIDDTEVPFMHIVTCTKEKICVKRYLRDERKSIETLLDESTFLFKDGKYSDTIKNIKAEVDADHVLVLLALGAYEIRKILEERGLLRELKENENRGSGVVVSIKDNDVITKIVYGRNRPDLPCMLFGGLFDLDPEDAVMMRPYVDEMVSDMMRPEMSVDDKTREAEKGDQDCMEELAQAYLTGDGVEQDFKKSAYWWEKLAEAGDSSAQFNIGLYYAKGCGVERDFEKAALWMEKAAQTGDEDAPLIAQEYRKINEDLKKAKAGEAQAQADLAGAFMKLGNSLDPFGPGKDYKDALFWAEKAEANDNPDAMWILALAYEHGRGVKADARKAVSYFEKGAALENAECQHSLGCEYMTGRNLKQNKEKGFELFLKSAQQGYGLAMRDVGYCYQIGEGCGSDLEKAAKWYEKALEKIDEPEVKQRLAMIKIILGNDEEQRRKSEKNRQKKEALAMKKAAEEEQKKIEAEKAAEEKRRREEELARKQKEEEEARLKKEAEEEKVYQEAREAYQAAYGTWEKECEEIRIKRETYVQKSEQALRTNAEAVLKARRDKAVHDYTGYIEALNKNLSYYRKKLATLGVFKMNEKREVKEKITALEEKIRGAEEKLQTTETQYNEREPFILQHITKKMKEKEPEIEQAFVLPPEPEKPEKPLSLVQREKRAAKEIILQLIKPDQKYALLSLQDKDSLFKSFSSTEFKQLLQELCNEHKLETVTENGERRYRLPQPEQKPKSATVEQTPQKTQRTPTKTQIVDEYIKAEILEAMSSGQPYLISELLEQNPNLAEYPSQKIVALLRELVNESQLKREVIKGKAYFSLA